MSQADSLEISNLSCIRDDRTLFEGINLSLSAGQMLLVEGANGSGKTSLLRILTGLKLADAGEVLWNNESIQNLTGDFYQQVCYVGHHDGVKRELTCLENLRLNRAMGIESSLSLDEVLRKVGLFRYGETLVGSLSAGQKRRLALARLFATSASLWILDEPFTSLDKASMAEFEEFFAEHLANQGMLIMTSHHEHTFSEQNLQRLKL